VDTGSPDSDVIVLVPELMGEATRSLHSLIDKMLSMRRLEAC
jgi:hypothetical protein